MPKTQKTRNVIKPALMTPELFDFLGPLFLVDGELQEVVDEFEKAKLRDKARLAGKDVDVLVKLGVSYTYAEIIVAALGGGAKTSKADRKDERKEDSKETRRPGGGPHVQIQGTMQDYLLALPVNELIEGYEPRNAAAPNNLALKTKVGDKRCVVFTDDGQVDRKVTTKLTDEIIDGQPERTKYQGPDDVLPRVVYRVGELPDELSIVRVCCAHNCEVRKDGECTSPDEEHWTNIHEVAEHVIAIGRELGDGSILRLVQNGPDLKRFLREVRGKGHDETISALKDISSNAVTVYGQRKRTGQPMPNLRRPRSELRNAGGQGEKKIGDIKMGSGVTPMRDGSNPLEQTSADGLWVLSGEEVRELKGAILGGYPTNNALGSFVRTKLNPRPEWVTNAANLDVVVGELIEWAESKDMVPDLLAALKHDSFNQSLRTCVDHIFARRGQTEETLPIKSHELKGNHIRSLQGALVSAFPSFKDMANMLLRLDKVLGQICTENDNMTNVAFDLIRDATSKGYLRQLIRAAYEHAPDNEKMAAFYRRCTFLQ